MRREYRIEDRERERERKKVKNEKNVFVCEFVFE